MIRAIVFDLDDTLFPEQEYVVSGFKAVDQWMMLTTGIRGFFEETLRLFKQGHRGTIFNEALWRIGVPFDDRFIQQAVKVYREHTPEIQLFEDAKWALTYYRQFAKIGLITDGYKVSQRKKIQALNIESFFDEIVVTDEYGKENWKPSKFPYCHIMKKFEVQGQECVYIGDNPEKDFITARLLGWKTIRVQRESGLYRHGVPNAEYEADVVIQNLYQLQDVLDLKK